MFIFYIVYPKYQVSLNCNENKEICIANFDDAIEIYFLLGINKMWSRSQWVKEPLTGASTLSVQGGGGGGAQRFRIKYSLKRES